MSQGKSGRENASKELLEDETNFGNTGNDLDSLVQEGKPEKLSVLLPKDPEDLIGNEVDELGKEMDMKLLKNTIWEYIASHQENVPEIGRRKPVLFSDVYSSLPKLLPPEESAKLTSYSVFMAVLHLATESRVSIVCKDIPHWKSDFEIFTV